MRIRTLVPALACLAAAPAFISAADTAPAAKIDGFVDTIYGWTDNKSEDLPAGTTDRVASGFSYFAKVGVEISINDKVSGQIDITNNNNSYTDNTLWVRQAYGTWKITPEVTFKSGEFINCIGWTAPYAPSLYRVNAGIITGLYGDFSTVGADVTYAKDALTLEAALTNGFFGEGTGRTQQVTGTNYGYALYLDGTYALPDKKGSVDAEFVYDAEASESVAPTGARGGAGYHLGLNATLTPSDPVTVGLEAIYQKIKSPDDAGDVSQKNVGLTALGNYKIPNAKWNASVTGQVSYVKKTNLDLVDGASSKATEVAVAVLTNPAGTDKFGVNAEIAYTKTDSDDGSGSATSSTTSKGWSISLEALYIIP